MAKKVNSSATEQTSEKQTSEEQTAATETVRITLHSTFQGILRHGGKKYRAGDTLDVSIGEVEKYGYRRLADVADLPKSIGIAPPSADKATDSSIETT